VQRLVAPVDIAFGQAIGIAVVGLIVNLVSACLLFDRDHHHHGHGLAAHDHHDHGDHHHNHGHDHDHPHHDDDDHHHHAQKHGHDNNLRAAYFQVLADALTSVLAVVALLAAR
jgi:Co/Zn/Cd efflux system component